MARSRLFAAASLLSAVAVLSVAGTTLGQSPPASPGVSAPRAVPAPSEDPGGSPATGAVATITDGEGFAGSLPRAMAVGPDGSLVMGGGTGPDPARPDDAVLWHSTDGVAWTETVLPKSQGLTVAGMTDIPTGWVAIATQPFVGGGLVYTSKDGTTWKHGKDFGAGHVEALISTPDGFLVAADTLSPDGRKPVLWRSPNLKRWKKQSLPGSGSGVDIAQAPSGATVVLVDQVDDNHIHSYSYARSADGSSWEPVDFPAVASGPDDTVTAGDLGTAGDLLVQLVNVRAGDVTTGSIWTSPDGAAWTSAYEAPGSLSLVASGPTGVVVGPDVEVTSADGVTWSASPQPGLGSGAAGAVLPDGRVVVAGSGYGDQGPFLSVQIVPAPAGFVASAPPGPAESPATP